MLVETYKNVDELSSILAKVLILTASMISIMLTHMALTLKHSLVGLIH